jgi:branched-chain amino acid aminotransferase
MISDVQRIPAASVDPTAKNYHWNDLTMGLLGALDAGADSVLLVDSAGNVVEGPGFNIFCFNHGAIVTPKEGMLEGVSRRTVLEIAQTLGLKIELRALPAQELRGAQEVFISTSGGGVLPVTMVDNYVIGEGEPGPITRQLVKTYWAWHADPAYSLAIDYSR